MEERKEVKLRIAIADNQNLMFDKELKEHWEKKHEVKYEMGASELLFKWCDLYYVNFWDGNINYLWEWHKKHPRVKKPKIVVRAIDWDVWCGLVRTQEQIDWVDVAICIAPHIKKKLEKEAKFGNKLHLIRPGIDLDKWTFHGTRVPRKKIIMPVNEIDWYLKHTIEGLKIFAELLEYDKSWELTVKGKWCQQEYFQELIKHYVGIAKIEENVIFDSAWVDDFNVYLDGFDYMLLPSLKEAFSFNTAQCAAKGIKPILNWWLGAEDIWPKGWLYRTAAEAIHFFIEDKHTPDVYRRIVEDKYDIKRMLKEMDAVCGV